MMRLLQLCLGWTLTTLCVVTFSLSVFPETAEAAWLTGWDYRKAITIDNTNVDSNLSSFPLYVKINNDTDLANATSSTGADLRFTTSTGVLLAYEKEDFTVAAGSGSGNFWVKVPDVSSSTGTIIYMYYGGADMTDGEDAENVWDDAVAVWHMSEGSGETVYDSTSNDNDGTLTSMDPETDWVVTEKGWALDFDSTDYVLTSYYPSASAKTLSAWVNFDDVTERSFGVHDGANHRFYFGLWSSNQYWFALGSAFKRTVVSGITPGTWHHFYMVGDNGTCYCYVDGELVDSFDYTFSGTSTVPYEIGGWWYAGNPTYTSFDGRIANVSIYSRVPTADEIKFAYNNMNEADQEMTFAAEETPDPFSWLGTTNSNWSTDSNWFGGTAPGTGDIAVFDKYSGATDCDIDESISVAGINITAGYTGTITQTSTYTVTVGASNYTQAGGTFTGGTNGMTLTGDFNMSGGTLNAGSQTITVSGNWAFSGGTFNAQTGTVEFVSHSKTITGSTTFNNFILDNLAPYYQGHSIAEGTTLTVTGTLTLDDGAINGPGAITAEGNVVINSEMLGGIDGTVVVVTIAGGVGQTVTINGGIAPDLIFNNSNLNVTPSADWSAINITFTAGTFNGSTVTTTVSGNWTLDGGTFNANTGTVEFVSHSKTITGSTTFNDLIIDCPGQSHQGNSIAEGTTLTVTGTLTLDDGPINGPGAITAEGNVVVNSEMTGGNVAITFSGSDPQTYTDNGGTFPSGTVTINKADGAVTLASAASVNASNQDLAITNGTLDLAGYTLTVNDQFTIGANGTLALLGSETVSTIDSNVGSIEYNATSSSRSIKDWDYSNAILKFTGSGGTFVIPSSETVAGFELGAGANGQITSGQTLTVSGNFISTATSDSHATLSAVTPDSVAYMPVSGTATVNYIEGTDIDSSGGTEVDNTTGGASTNCTNWHVFNIAPTLTSVADSPDPIKGGETITITPTGQADTDSDALYFYCNESGTPTSGNTLCSEANASYSSPYSAMTCTYAVSTGDTTRTVYCRVYDATVYNSADITTTYTVDTTAPSVISTSPADEATGIATTATIEITFDEEIDTGTGSITLEDSSGPVSTTITEDDATYTVTISPDAPLSEDELHTVTIGEYAVEDVYGNTMASSAFTFTTADESGPTISSVAATATSSGASIAWTTNEESSSKVHYGTDSTLGNATVESDTSTRVTSHSVNMQGLASCAQYYYKVQSADANSNIGTGSLLNFTTTGCTGDAEVETQTGSTLEAGTGGTVSIAGTNTGITLTVPADFSTNDARFQIMELDPDTVISTTSTPSNYQRVGRVYNLLALSGATTSVTSFDQAITITMEYTDAEAAGYSESSFRIYRWNGSSWNVLSNCVVDAGANTVTCTTTSFSNFSLFGQLASSDDSSSDTTTGGSGGGHRGSGAGMSSRISAAHTAILARYEKSRSQALAMADEEQHDEATEVPESFETDEERRMFRANQKSNDFVQSHAAPPASERRGRLYMVVEKEPVLFRDVPIDAWYTPFVVMLIEEDIAQSYRDDAGQPKGEFGVANPITHAEVLKMALQAASKTITGLPPPRNPSARGTWVSAYVSVAEQLNLSIFATDRDVHTPATRGQVIQTILEVMDLPIASQAPTFSDVQVKHPHSNAIATATFYGLVTGDMDRDGNPTGAFRPDDPINRAEVAKIIALVKEVIE